jgi:hypothetical protein
MDICLYGSVTLEAQDNYHHRVQSTFRKYTWH